MGATKIKNIYQNQPGTNRPLGANEVAGIGIGAPQGIYETSTTKKARIGTRLAVGNRVFRYALNGGVALTAGMVIGSALLGGSATTNQVDALVSVASLLGDTRIFIDILTTAQVAGLYADGWMGIEDDSTGDYYNFQIKNNIALAIAADTTGYVDLYDGVPVALTTSDTVALLVNPYSKVIVFPTGRTPANMLLGVTPMPVAIGSYFWLQTAGPCACLNDAGEACVSGLEVGTSDDTAGAVEGYHVAESGPIIGRCMMVPVGTSDLVMVDLNVAY
jgi:hypothetical protein